MYDESDYEGEGSDAGNGSDVGNGDTCGFKRYANKPKGGPKIWKWEDAEAEPIFEFKDNGLEFTSDNEPVGESPHVELYRETLNVEFFNFFLALLKIIR